MQALCVKQPWATLIASGAKTIETRTWPTQYRGTIVIASSKEPRIHPAGYLLAIAELVDCRPMTRSDESKALCRVADGVWAWVLGNIRAIEPVRLARGRSGLFEVELVETDVVLKSNSGQGIGNVLEKFGPTPRASRQKDLWA